jgi:hypothetical protein
VDGAAVVIGGAAERVQLQQNRLTAGERDVAVGGESAQAVVCRRARHRVVDVDVLVVPKRGIERHAQQSPLAGRIDGECQEGRREQCTVLDDPQLTALADR